MEVLLESFPLRYTAPFYRLHAARWFAGLQIGTALVAAALWFAISTLKDTSEAHYVRRVACLIVIVAVHISSEAVSATTDRFKVRGRGWGGRARGGRGGNLVGWCLFLVG